jgi:hypothetical protein
VEGGVLELSGRKLNSRRAGMQEAASFLHACTPARLHACTWGGGGRDASKPRPSFYILMRQAAPAFPSCGGGEGLPSLVSCFAACFDHRTQLTGGGLCTSALSFDLPGAPGSVVGVAVAGFEKAHTSNTRLSTYICIEFCS